MPSGCKDWWTWIKTSVWEITFSDFLSLLLVCHCAMWHDVKPAIPAGTENLPLCVCVWTSLCVFSPHALRAVSISAPLTVHKASVKSDKIASEQGEPSRTAWCRLSECVCVRVREVVPRDQRQVTSQAIITQCWFLLMCVIMQKSRCPL